MKMFSQHSALNSRWRQMASVVVGLLVLMLSLRVATAVTLPNESGVQVTYYVAASGGSDSNAGTSSSAPFATFNKGMGMARTQLNNGQKVKVILKNGTHRWASREIFGSSSNAAHRNALFIIQGESAGGVTLDGAGAVHGRLEFSKKHNVVIRNIIFKNARDSQGQPAIALRVGQWEPIDDNRYWLIENCEFNNNKAGAYLWHIRDLTVRNCKTLNNKEHGLRLVLRDALLQDVTVTNNWLSLASGGGASYGTGAILFAGMNVTMRRVKSNDNYGQGFDMDHVAENVVVEDSEFNRNGAYFNGHGAGGTHWETALGPVTVRNTQIKDNRGEAGVMLATVHNFTLDNCTIQNNYYSYSSSSSKISAQIVIVDKDRPVNPDGCVGDCGLGAGNLNQSPGNTWTNQQGISWVANTKIRNCTITTNKGANSRLIAKRPGDGRIAEYNKWVKTELDANYNTYYNPDNTNVFNTDYDGHMTNFAGWKTAQNVDPAQGDDQNSCWGAPGSSACGGSSASTIKVETYDPPEQKSSDVHLLAADSNASSGTFTVLKANASGDYVTYKVPNVQAQSYDVYVQFKKGADRGKCQMSIAPSLSGQYDNHGSVQDLFNTAYSYNRVKVTTMRFGTSGTKYVKFTSAGKNSSANGYWLAIDYIELVPTP